MNRELTDRWSLTETLRRLRGGQTTPQALLDRALARITNVDAHVRAWTRADPQFARLMLEATLNSTDHGPLWGVPVGVKDIIDVAGLPTECGSRLRAGSAPAQADAAVVHLLRERGAIPIGKTVTTEFAYFSPGPTRNPVRLEHTPGGSSSGSAAAVAAGMVPLAIGSQTAGSLTRPAAYCGVAGLVLTTGSIPTDGVVGLSPSLDTLGLLAATTTDLYTAWAAMFADAELERIVDGHAAEPAAPRLLVWHPRGIETLDESMSAALALATSRLAATGAKLDPLDWDSGISRLTDDQATVMAYEAARERRAEFAHASELSKQLTELLRRGSELDDLDYQAAGRRIEAAGHAFADLLGSYDAVLGPAALGPAPKGLAATGSPVLSRPWQALGLPVVTIPGMTDRRGLPLGLQLIGRQHSEKHLLRLGTWIERHLPRSADPPTRGTIRGCPRIDR